MSKYHWHRINDKWFTLLTTNNVSVGNILGQYHLTGSWQVICKGKFGPKHTTVAAAVKELVAMVRVKDKHADIPVTLPQSLVIK